MTEKQTLDVKGLLCPLPVLKAKKMLRSIERGGQLEVLTTDRGAVADFQCLAEEDDLLLLAQEETDGVCRHLIQKGTLE